MDNEQEMFERLRDVENSVIKLDGRYDSINEKLDDIKVMLKDDKKETVTKDFCKQRGKELQACFDNHKDLRKDFETARKDATEELALHIKEHSNNNSNYIKYFVIAILGAVISVVVNKL